MTVGDLMDRMSSSELTEWQAYFELVAYEQERRRRLAEKGISI